MKITGIALGSIVGVFGITLGVFAAKWQPTFPDTPKPDITASDDPQVIAHGKYLFEAVAHCGACHMPAEDYWAWKPGDAMVPKGGHEWHFGPLGTIRSPKGSRAGPHLQPLGRRRPVKRGAGDRRGEDFGHRRQHEGGRT